MKILIYGQPKTGTTILFYKIQKAFEKRFPGKPLQTLFEPDRMRVENDRQILGITEEFEFSVEDNYLIKALIPIHKGVGFDFSHAKELLAEKKILIVRDPRDRWISALFYRWFRKCEESPEEFQKVIKLTQFKEQNPQALPAYSLLTLNPKRLANHARTQHRIQKEFAQILEYARENNWFIFLYEDLVTDKFDKLNQYLGLDVGAGEVSKTYKRVARSKKAGNWRQWFTEEDLPYFQEIFNPYLNNMGYDENDWVLEKPKSIDPKQGSDYLKSLGAEKQMLQGNQWQKLLYKLMRK